MLIADVKSKENEKAADNGNDEHDNEHKRIANGCYNNAKDEYQNIIEDDREKQQIIWLLKKLEKTKPVEISWLDEIKKEKAAAKAKEEAAAGSGAVEEARNERGPCAHKKSPIPAWQESAAAVCSRIIHHQCTKPFKAPCAAKSVEVTTHWGRRRE